MVAGRKLKVIQMILDHSDANEFLFSEKDSSKGYSSVALGDWPFWPKLVISSQTLLLSQLCPCLSCARLSCAPLKQVYHLVSLLVNDEVNLWHTLILRLYESYILMFWNFDLAHMLNHCTRMTVELKNICWLCLRREWNPWLEPTSPWKSNE